MINLPFVENLSTNGLLAKVMQSKAVAQNIKAQPTDFLSEGCAFSMSYT